MHFGPGTSMVQFTKPYAGMGACGSCETRASLGTCCSGCASGQGCTGGLTGMGLFESMDFTTWGIGEWGLIALGLYLAGSVFGDVGRARKSVRRYKSRSRRRQQLKEQLRST